MRAAACAGLHLDAFGPGRGGIARGARAARPVAAVIIGIRAGIFGGVYHLWGISQRGGDVFAEEPEPAGSIRRSGGFAVWAAPDWRFGKDFDSNRADRRRDSG